MAKIQSSHTGMLLIYIPKAIENEYNLKPGDDIEIKIVTIARKPKKEVV